MLRDGEPHSAAMNMAIDETLLRTATQPILRFYGWRQPSLSFGYFGCFADVATEAPARELVRRWTGGGIVLHGEDLTYSIILPRRGAENNASPETVYQMIHGAMQKTLAAHFDVSLADKAAAKISDDCFANAVTADVLVRGRKIAGAAQRRTRAGLLHQGSIRYRKLPASFPNAFAATLCADFCTMTLDPDFLRQAQTLAGQKYGTPEWLRRR